MPAAANIATNVQAPHASGKRILKKLQNQFPVQEKIDRNRIKIHKKFWRYNVQFGTLLIIDTSPKSPRILNYSNDSE
jgi:hypothetical protein